MHYVQNSFSFSFEMSFKVVSTTSFFFKFSWYEIFSQIISSNRKMFTRIVVLIMMFVCMIKVRSDINICLPYCIHAKVCICLFKRILLCVFHIEMNPFWQLKQLCICSLVFNWLVLIKFPEIFK